MPRLDLPPPAPGLELAQLLGTWYVLFSNRADWRSRTHPRVEFDPLTPSEDRARLQTTLRFRSADLLGRAKPRVTTAEAIAEPDDPPGLFSIRGHGLIRLSSSRFCVAIHDPERRWAVVWHGRSSLGHAPGVDVHTRDPSLPQAQVDTILAAIAEHPFLASRGAGLFATTQHWFPVEPYRLR